METMRDIRNRMKSVRQTRQITGALKLISTSKLRKARRRLEDTLPYFEGISDAMRDIVCHSEENGQKWFDKRERKADRKIATLVITANMGKAGGYNHAVIRYVEERCPEGSFLMFVGNVGKRYFVEKNYVVLEDFVVNTKEPSVYEAKEIAAFATSQFLAGKIDEFRIVYTRMRSIVLLEPTMQVLLPLDAIAIAKAGGPGQGAGAGKAAEQAGASCDGDLSPYRYLPSEAGLFDALVPQYLEGIAYGALVSAFASEQAARMTAMEAATKNADEMLGRLSLRYNRARQATITSEITEIVAGAAALED
jgi:F-type H+-transporting ATPase subunit gamma